jgi:hypothetical protein
MKSEDYRKLINNERFSLDLTEEEFDNTLMHFAKLYHQEQKINIANIVDRLPEDTVIRDNAREMDEKEFENWWWETIYKSN